MVAIRKVIHIKEIHLYDFQTKTKAKKVFFQKVLKSPNKKIF